MSRRVRALTNRSFPWTDPDPERRNAALVVAAIGFVVLVALALIAYGYYDDRIAPKYATVLQVGDRKFDFDYLDRRAYASFLQGQLNRSNLAQGIADTLTKVEREELIRRTARNQGMTVSEDEMDRVLRTLLAVPVDASRDEVAPRYRGELLRLGLSPSEYRDIMLAELLQERMRLSVEKDVPPEAEYVNLGVIQTRVLAEAQQAKQRLENGEAFGTVASSVSLDSSKSNDGDRGWTPKGSLPPKMEAVAFSQLGRSDVFEGDDGSFYIIEVRGKELRKVDAAGSRQIVDFALQAILKKTSETANSDFKLTSGQLQKIAAKLTKHLAQQNQSGA